MIWVIQEPKSIYGLKKKKKSRKYQRMGIRLIGFGSWQFLHTVPVTGETVVFSFVGENFAPQCQY